MENNSAHGYTEGSEIPEQVYNNFDQSKALDYSDMPIDYSKIDIKLNNNYMWEITKLNVGVTGSSLYKMAVTNSDNEKDEILVTVEELVALHKYLGKFLIVKSDLK